MKQLLVIAFIFISCAAHSQTKPTKQDSINVFNAQVKKATDSILSKTSMKEFQLWLDENVSSKSMREGTLNNLWSVFVNTRLEEWAKKNKIIVPQN